MVSNIARTGQVDATLVVPLPLPEEMDAERPVTTPLAAGVRETIELLRDALQSVKRGLGTAGRVGS